MYNNIFDSAAFVWEAWEHNAELYPDKDAIVHWIADEEPQRWSFKTLLNKAYYYAALLKKNGIKEGEVCALIIKHNFDFYPIYMGISLAGAIPAVLAYPNPRLHPDKFRQGIEGMSLRSGLDWILTEHSIEEIISPLVKHDESTIKGLLFPFDWDEENIDLNTFSAELKENRKNKTGNEPFLLQHSSGTTGLQKPVLLSHKAILSHVKNYAEAIKLNDIDKVASWLPLYHDMGLIAAFHLPLAFGITSIQINTFEWIVVPSLLLEVVSKEKVTLSWLPNFSYNVMADKIHDDELPNIDLSTWRLLINCSEPVRAESHDKFYKRFNNIGLKEESLATCYAMAETTYAVTQTTPGKIPNIVYANRKELANGNLQIIENTDIARSCVSSGSLIDGCEIRIVDENRNDLPEDKVGEIAIKSVSMFDGYRNYPEKTAEAVSEGWYYSGDYGFKYNNEYYVIGRKKDIIISAGNNIYPEDVEDTISKVEGVIPGRVVAFGEFDEALGSENISVIAETNIDDEQLQKKLKINILKAAMSTDLTIKKIYLVPSRWLIKSSAGKPSRKANKERILSNEVIKWSLV